MPVKTGAACIWALHSNKTNAINGTGRMDLVVNSQRINEEEKQTLNLISEQSIEIASRLTDQFFSATDDLFYELSERASTNNEENLYFEAMRAIRVSKNELEQGFTSGLKENFQLIVERSESEQNASKEGDELSIVEREDLEVQLAQKNMADRTRDSYKPELYDLVARLNALLKNCEVTQANNPLDPLQLSRAFVRSTMTCLKLDIKTRLIFFKLFEKHFLKQLGHLYADANKLLVEKGILPKVPRKGATSDAGDDHPQSAIQAQAQEEQEHFETFGEPLHRGPAAPFQLETNALASLMATIRAARNASIPGVQALGNYQYYSTNPGAVMPIPELADFLTNNQTELDEKLSSETPQNLVPQIVTDILALKNPEKPQALDQPDEDIINLVALFFDKVLEDENIPVAVQSLICRLQIPVLKIALNDKTFLTDTDHPARTLINTITEAGLSFDDSKPVERDPLYGLLTDCVQKINHQFNLELDIFSEAYEKIQEAMQQELNRAGVVESRTKQTEAGKAKLKAARTFAQNALYEKLKDIQLPFVINDFLTNTWLQVMIITYVRSGKESQTWVENEQLISDLVWAAQAYDDEKSQNRQKRLIPGILEKVESGLELVVDNADVRKAKSQQIEHALGGVCSGSLQENHYEELNEEQKSKLGKNDPEKKTWEEMTALERQQARYEELSSQCYLDAKNMPVGTWLLYTDENKGKELRCKLSAKVDADNYIFVNRFGFKAIVKSRRQFAYDMQFKKAKVIDSNPMFERLMDKVVTQIKSLSEDL